MCLFDRSRGTKTFHKILRGTSAKMLRNTGLDLILYQYKA